MLYIERYVHGFLSYEVFISSLGRVLGYFVTRETKALHKETYFEHKRVIDCMCIQKMYVEFGFNVSDAFRLTMGDVP
jgi:hypothetical protein